MALNPSISPELKTLMNRLRIARLLETLPERLTLAKTNNLSHLDFLELLFSDEVSRRDSDSYTIRARSAQLDPTMVLEYWDNTAEVTYDKQIFTELVSLRFIDQAQNVFILGPVGVGKTFLATTLGHIACRRHF
ncbi:IstB domain protein ATP-binding protein, partial [mine drainage metagenome]